MMTLSSKKTSTVVLKIAGATFQYPTQALKVYIVLGQNKIV
jgi:hypothetical protein